MALTYYGYKNNSFGASSDSQDPYFAFQTIDHTGDIGANISVTDITACSISAANTNGSSSTGVWRMAIEAMLNGSWYQLGYIQVNSQLSSHQTFSNFILTANADVKSLMGKYAPSALRGKCIAGYFHLNAGSELRLAANTVTDVSACSAPTSVTVNPSSAAPNGTVTLQWSGAAAGPSNPIASYKISRSTTSNGTYTDLKTVTSAEASGSTTVNAPAADGDSYYYKVQTVGTVSGYDSAPSTAYATLTCAFSAPTAPTNVATSAALVNPGDTLSLAFSGESAGTGNAITAYDVYRSTAVNGDYILLIENATASPVAVIAPTAQGTSYYYRVVTKGTYSNSEISTAYGTVKANTAPTAPNVAAPVNNGSTYSTTPGVKITAGAEPDGQVQTIQMSDNGGAYVTLGTMAAGGATVVYTPALTEGSHVLVFRILDSLGLASTTVTRNITVAVPVWSRVIVTGTVFASQLVSGRTDITELLAAINTIRTYYGLDAITLSGIGQWAQWKANLQALQVGLAACFIAAGVTVPTWITVPSYPTASIINQLRTQLRNC